MASKPEKCPRCGSTKVYPIGEHTGGISAGKAAVGGLLLGPVGLLGGVLGKKRVVYQCKTCSYTIEK